MRRLLFILGLGFFLSSGLFGQALPEPEPLTPEDYDPEEFPLWAQDLRRYEVISVGAFPITFFAASMVYDFSIYASNRFDPAYSMGTQRSRQDIGIIIGSAAAVSVLIATVDMIINLNQRKKSRQTDEAPGGGDEQ